MKMKVYEAIAEALSSAEVEVVFAMMTSDNMALVNHLAAKGIRIVNARTEHGAICMADGYARATGRLAVATIGTGPSAAMAGTPLVTARKKRSPLVVICGDVPITNRHHLKGFDQHAFFENTAGYCLSVSALRTVVEDTYQVLRHARSDNGPAVLNVPVDLLESELDIEDIGADWRYMPSWIEVPSPAAAPAQIRQAAELLANAERPLIIAGRGAVIAGARDALSRCGERVGALLGTSLQAQDFFDGDYAAGIVGTLGFGGAMQLVDQADVVLAVGASLNVYTTGFGQLFPQARIVQIDARPEAFGAMTPVDISIVADAREGVEALNARLEAMSVSNRTGFRTAETRASLEQARRVISRDYKTSPDLLDPRQLLDVLQERLPAQRLDILDAGHFVYFVIDHIRARQPQNRLWTADFASIGLGVPTGIGAAIAQPQMPAVVFVGDGGFMFSLVELDTAVRLKIPMTVIVVNDEAFGAEVRYLQNRKLPYDLACYPSPAFEQVVKGLGCEAATVRTAEQLLAACDNIGKFPVPYVIDARIDLSVAHRTFGNRQVSAADAH
jgi:thiamine pyrophosphate-dependent acetolactate synthase large subunit-like protein